MITLWGRNNSTNVKKVRWMLEELELPYEHILAGGQYGLNHDADYLAMNPNGLVPLLRDDETQTILWESNTILRYLAAQYGQRRLWVDEPAARAQGEKWMDWALSTLAPRHGPVLVGLVRTAPEKRNLVAIEAQKQALDKLFDILDEALAEKQWLSGTAFGCADMAVGPFIYNLYNIPGLTWAPRANLQRWYQKLCERPAFRETVMIPVT